MPGPGGLASNAVRADTTPLVDVLARVYEATLEVDAWPRILTALAPLFSTNKAFFTRVDRLFPSESTTEVIGVAPDLVTAIRNRNLDQDQLWRAVMQVEVGGVCRASELIPLNVYQRAPLYDQIGRPAGINYVLGGIIENGPEYFATISFMHDTVDFTDAQKDLLRTIVPHLRTACRIGLRIALGDAGRREALLSFDRARQAVVVLDRSGYAIYSNEAARQVLEQANGVTLKFGRFLFQNIATQTEFERVVRLAMSSYFRDAIPIPHEVRVPRYGPGSPYAMSVIPLTSSGDRAVLPDGAGCLVLLYDLEVANPLPVDRLAWLYRLTPAESRVCASLFRAGSVDAVADDLSLTRNTVRSHLKSIYAKFGVVSQGQLMQRLANSLRLTEGARDKGPTNPQA